MTGWKRTLKELLAGVILSGVVFGVMGLFFVKDKTAHVMGMCIGVLIALTTAIHLAYAINRALDWDEENAKRAMWKCYGIRYLATAICMWIIACFQIGNLVSCFFGMMGLKIAVYLQPQIHKFCNKYIRKIEEGGETNGTMGVHAKNDLSNEAKCGFYDPWSDRI